MRQNTAVWQRRHFSSCLNIQCISSKTIPTGRTVQSKHPDWRHHGRELTFHCVAWWCNVMTDMETVNSIIVWWGWLCVCHPDAMWLWKQLFDMYVLNFFFVSFLNFHLSVSYKMFYPKMNLNIYYQNDPPKVKKKTTKEWQPFHMN